MRILRCIFQPLSITFYYYISKSGFGWNVGCRGVKTRRFYAPCKLEAPKKDTYTLIITNENFAQMTRVGLEFGFLRCLSTQILPDRARVRRQLWAALGLPYGCHHGSSEVHPRMTCSETPSLQ